MTHSAALHEVGKVGEELVQNRHIGNLQTRAQEGLQLKDISTNQAQQSIQGFTRTEITMTWQGGKSFEMGVEKREPLARRKVLNLFSDIVLARKERSKCSGANAENNSEFSG